MAVSVPLPTQIPPHAFELNRSGSNRPNAASADRAATKADVETVFGEPPEDLGDAFIWRLPDPYYVKLYVEGMKAKLCPRWYWEVFAQGIANSHNPAAIFLSLRMVSIFKLDNAGLRPSITLLTLVEYFAIPVAESPIAAQTPPISVLAVFRERCCAGNTCGRPSCASGLVITSMISGNSRGGDSRAPSSTTSMGQRMMR